METNTHEIFLAGGSFWGIERFMQYVVGVTETQVGYANSSVPSPSYDMVCAGVTGAVETVKVRFDVEQIDLLSLIDLFFRGLKQQDSRHANDTGSQYRTGIYYEDEADGERIRTHLEALSEAIGELFDVEVQRLVNFYPAEAYHQNYLLYHPNGYCQLTSQSFMLAQGFRPKVYKKQCDAKLQKTLTSTQYVVTQADATECPFTNQYCNLDEQGIYVDVTTGEPLFASKQKVNDGAGWPAFTSPINDGALVKRVSERNGLVRVEVRSALGDSHLGHLYVDPTGSHELIYRINSAALRFIPLKWMEPFGYGEYSALC